MSCDHCVQAVTKAATEAGARDVKVDLAGGTATFSYDEETVSLESIAESIEDQGFDVVA
jgi:copper chaperone